MPKVLAAALGAVTFAVYMIGSGRAFGFDAAVTMDRFVAHSPWTAFDRQLAVNNHPLLSFIESLIYDVAGGGEVVMRVAPALFAAAAVGLLAGRVGRSWSVAAGMVAGLTLAVNPMLVPLARDVRGYSLAILAIVVMGIAGVDRRPALFAVALFVGVATHMWAAVPGAMILAVLAARRDLDQRWRYGVLAAGFGVLLVYGWMLDETTTSNPTYLRFLYWAMPGVSVAAGWVVARMPRLLPVAVAVMVALAVPQFDGWGDDELGNREAADAVPEGACVPPLWPNDAVAFYVDGPRSFSCDAAVVMYPHRLDTVERDTLDQWPVVCASGAGWEVRARRLALSSLPLRSGCGSVPG